MISALRIVQVFVISAALLFYTGAGLIHLLAFRRLHGRTLLLIPFAGLSLIIPVGYWCSWSGRSAAFALAVTLIFSTLLNVLALVWRRDTLLPVGTHALVLVPGVLAFTLAVAPLARLGHPGPIGTNGDQVLYSNVTAYLEHAGLPTPSAVSSKPAITQLSFVNWGLPLGFNYLHAFVDELSGLRAHESFSLVTAVLLFLNILALWFLARSVFGLGLRGTFLTALLAAVSPVFLWVHYNDFGMHATSLSLVPVTLGVAVLSLEERSPQAWALPALLLSAAFTSYPFATVLVALAPLALYALLLHLKKRTPLTTTLGHLAGIAVLAFLLNIPGVLHVVKLLLPMFRFVLVKEFGDISEHVSWTEIYGIAHHAVSPAPFPFALFPSLSVLLGLAALGITVYGVWRMADNRRLLFLSLALAYFPFIVWLRFVLDYPYGAFKALTSTTFAAILGLASGVECLLDRRPGEAARAKALVWTFLTFLLLANISFALRLSQSVTPVELSPLAELQSGKGLARDGETIHIRDDRDTDLLWVTYFLKNYNLSLAHYSPYYMWRDWPFYRNAIATDLVLVRKPDPSGAAWAGELVHENSRYKLIRKDRGILVHLDFEEHARVLEKGQRIQISVFADHIDVDRTPFPLGMSLNGKGTSLRLGVFAPEGATIRVGVANTLEPIRVALKDLAVIDRPIEEFPLEITLANEGGRSVMVPGWLEVVDSVRGRDVEPEALFQRFQEEVVPGSGFFVVDGWQRLEQGKQRWTTAASHSVFRNPSKAVALNITGSLPDQPGIEGHVVLNDRILGKLDRPGEFSASFLVLPEVLGSSAWGDLGLGVNRAFNPLALGLSSDCRDLGVQVTDIGLRGLDLPTDGIIHLGGETARAYLGTGWSRSERWGPQSDRTVVWADAPESTLWFTLPRPSDFIVRLTLLPFTFPSSPPQSIRVFVNGRSVAEVTPVGPSWRTYSFELPRTYLSPGANTLRFVYNYVASPSKVVPGSEDPRTLAVAFDSIEFRENR
jgi:hypothetical protein